MKKRSTLALFVGAVPGAIPPLMGWTAVTGRLDAGGLALFALLFAWQLPHFLSISLYLAEDYARGGLKVFALVHGERADAGLDRRRRAVGPRAGVARARAPRRSPARPTAPWPRSLGAALAAYALSGPRQGRAAAGRGPSSSRPSLCLTLVFVALSFLPR